MRIVVAMSGGVDSSVAAGLLVEAGHEVIGLSMQLFDQRKGDSRFGACCTLNDLYDARRAAATLGIPHYVVDFSQQFEHSVIKNFVDEYVAGRTPIPCVHCNGALKFAALVERARDLDAEAVATGHYARASWDARLGRYLLRRGLDPSKDQSYFLFTLDQRQLARARFPVGDLDKTKVRTHAKRLGLPVAEKADSQEICFLPSGNHAAFIERRAPEACRPGVFADRVGRILGRHEGIHRFTVGQRKGLGLAAGTPLYVLAIDASTGTVTVGPRAALARSACTASRVNWLIEGPPNKPRTLAAQVRYRQPTAPARVNPLDGHRASVLFESPQPVVSPGQAVVFYDGDIVVGGGWID
jgi:tRNA-specific 2-thiouridylase